MSEAPEVYVNIGGELRRASDVNPPQDRTFRNAWQFNGSAVAVDMQRARAIQRDQIREIRKGKLAELDALYMLADETGDTAGKKAVAQQKKKLRDMPSDPRLDAAASPDALKALSFDALNA